MNQRLTRKFHTHEKIDQRNFRPPFGRSDFVAASPDEVGPTGRIFHTSECEIFGLAVLLPSQRVDYLKIFHVVIEIGRPAVAEPMAGRAKLAVFLAREGIDDLEVFDVVVEVRAKRQFHPEEFLHADEQVGVFAAESFEDARVDHYAKLVLLAVVPKLEPANHRAQLALQFNRHRGRRFHDPTATAIRAIRV